MGIKQRLHEARDQHPLLDHVLCMQEHYGSVKASQQAGAVTYFAFLAFFPILALAFFAVGLISHLYPDADENLVKAIDSVLPGIVGGDQGIALTEVRSFSGLAGIIGLLGVTYAGLSWLSALRAALTVVFETPERDRPGFVMGKLTDLATLAVIGVVLLLSVAVAGFVSGFSEQVLDWLGLGTELSWLVWLVAVLIGLAANAALFYVVFRLLGEPEVPRRSLWSGAVLGAVGFEILKQVSGLLLASTKNQPAFQAFGIALILVVWINYFSRLILYAASWAFTTEEARAQRLAEPADPVQGPPSPSLAPLVPDSQGDDDAHASSGPPLWLKPFAAGAGSMLAVIGLLRRRHD